MKIFLYTKNNFKYDEIKIIFRKYGLNIIKVNNYDDVLNFLKNKKEKFITFREETKLTRDSKIVNTEELKQLDLVTHTSTVTLNYFNFIDKNKDETKTFESSVNGFIDLHKAINNSNIVYNWDDIFVSSKTNKTYQELKNKNSKFSARTISVSHAIKDIISFQEKIDLNFNPMNQKNVIDFGDNIYNLIENNKYIKSCNNNDYLSNLISSVVSNGLFTRSAINMKQRNYWYPSLNAGLPLVPKKDEIHEITFMFHDLMHHAIPDLILSGDDSQSTKEAYIIHRMISEATSLVLADMLFVDSLVSSGFNYDWNKRKIYPIFKEFKKNGLSLDRLKKLVWANVQFALLGKEDDLRSLSSDEAVDDYKSKYINFFIEDYRWTINNYENMMADKLSLKEWSDKVNIFIDKENLVSEYSSIIETENLYDSKVRIIFEKMWINLELKMKKKEVFNLQKAKREAFLKYMTGQIFVFFKYDFDYESEIYFNNIINELKVISLNEDFIEEDIDRLRKYFNSYIDKLVSKELISLSDSINYKEIVPLFDTFFVFYDSNLKFNKIEEIIKKLI